MSDSSKRPNIIGEHIKAKRVEAGLLLREVAERAGVHESTISRIEHGLLLPPVDVLLRIGDALELDLTELLAKMGARFSEDLPDFETYLRAKYQLSEDVIARMAAYFKEQTNTD